ncbi:MAG: Dabb family protein [Saprospiraceae bacterium]|nr:Dabb family protein [Saprospiraceae bacterium]
MIHHVFFYMSPEATTEQKEALRSGIHSLTSIETIKQWHIGTPAPTDRPVIERGYAFSWLALFENGDDEAVYQSHPVHLEFIKNCAHLWTKVIVYDSI